jgi:branched-chain amino acid transport system ATP-binding protein
MTALLKLERLTRAFGGLVAANAVDFEVGSNQIIGLIGPNGAGKTTVFNMIGGTIPPSSGRITFEGQDCTGYPSHRMAQLGVTRTFQITSLFPGLSALDNVKIGTHRGKKSTFLEAFIRGARYRREEGEVGAKAAEILAFLGMAHQADVLAQNLPYGDQRKLEIAVALAADPKLLLLDEPAAGMNPDESRRLTIMIEAIRKRGISVLLVEHHMKVVMGVCDRIVVLNHGTKIAEGPPQVVANDPTVISVYLGREKAHA